MKQWGKIMSKMKYFKNGTYIEKSLTFLFSETSDFQVAMRSFTKSKDLGLSVLNLQIAWEKIKIARTRY